MSLPFYEAPTFEPEVEFEQLPPAYGRKEERPSKITRLVTVVAASATSFALVTILSVQGAALTGQYHPTMVRFNTVNSQPGQALRSPSVELSELDDTRVLRPKGKQVAATTAKVGKVVKGSPRKFLDVTID